MKKAIIVKVKSGKLKGQLRFNLVAANGQVIAGSQGETYHNLDDCVTVIQNNFPDFSIIDESKPTPGFILLDADENEEAA